MCAVCSVQCEVCSVQCAVCSVQCAVCSVHCGELHTLVRATCVDVSGHDASLEALRSYWCDTGTSTRARDAPTACTLCG